MARNDRIIQVEGGQPLWLDNLYDLRQALCLVIEFASDDYLFDKSDRAMTGVALIRRLQHRQGSCVHRKIHRRLLRNAYFTAYVTLALRDMEQSAQTVNEDNDDRTT